MVVKLLDSCSSAGVQVRKTIPNYRVSALPVAAGVRILSGASRDGSAKVWAAMELWPVVYAQTRLSGALESAREKMSHRVAALKLI